MRDVPLVSVVMAVHNGLPYLPEAIQSLLRQTLTSFECIIVDDASTDGTPECVRSYRDQHVRLICNAQRVGQTRSLNDGLRACQGSYVARFDADDVCLPERLQRQVQFLEEHLEVSVVGSRMVGIDAVGRSTEGFGKRVNDRPAFVAWLLLGVCPLGHPSVMLRRAAIEAVGGYDERYRIGQDYALWIRMAQRGFTARVLPERLVMYRTHQRQQSVAARAAHRGELRVIHERFVQEYCPVGQALRVARILRLDDRFWHACASTREVGAAAIALEQTIAQACRALKLTTAEANQVKRAIYQQVGLGVRLAPRFAGYPSWVGYPAVGLLSPMLIPHVYRALAVSRRGVRACCGAVGGVFRTPHHHRQMPDPRVHAPAQNVERETVTVDGALTLSDAASLNPPPAASMETRVRT